MFPRKPFTGGGVKGSDSEESGEEENKQETKHITYTIFFSSHHFAFFASEDRIG